ncbi:endolytic transglycosylase MltG [Flavicella sp.]|uniref:endolytic transglycosylase MltG n=1 Tax=Flavicella sp. TaxID=2957742 RepID=UPI0030165834
MNKKNKIISGVLIVIPVLTLLIGYHYYSKIYHNNVLKNTELFIPTNTNIDGLTQLLSPIIKNTESFKWVATTKKYSNRIKSGKYAISKGMNNNDLINLLRSGKQTAVHLSFNNQHLLKNLAGRISTQIEPDSLSLLKAFQDETFLKKNNFNLETALAMYIPNSYQVYWNTSAEGFRNKMLKEYKIFWNKQRRRKAKAQNLTLVEVITLASIVQKETAHIAERPIVAGLYLNRYHDQWPLQADPTIIYSLKQKHGQDFEVKRVLLKDLKTDSPYNTYKYRGIPPGPIAMPDISSIDAVLNPKKHNYYYMCANIDEFGKHTFSKTLSEHNRNAQKYQRWISKQGVNR